MISNASQQGLIEPVGATVAKDGRLVREWRGVEWTADEA